MKHKNKQKIAYFLALKNIFFYQISKISSLFNNLSAILAIKGIKI